MKPQDRTRAFLTAKIDAQSKLVGIAIADHMDVHDTCYPSVGRLAEVTGLAERSVQTVLGAAIAAGWLRTEGEIGKRRTFTVAWDVLAVSGRRPKGVRKVAKVNPRTGRTPASGAPVHGAHPTPAAGAPGGVHGAPETLHGAHPKRDHEKQTNEPTTGGPAREEGMVINATVTPPALPEQEDGPLVVNGVELPRDLPALLSGIQPGFMHFIRMLLPAGVENTERLLRLAREDWRFMGHGLNPAKVNTIEAHLSATWGVSLGALAKAEDRTKGKAAPKLFAPKGGGPSVDAIDHLFRKKEPIKEVTRAE